jgi:WD40-like Beta Propeller Repeat
VAGATWASSVQSTSARLHAELDPNGNATSYHFDYISEAKYEANLAAAKDGFAGAPKAPPVVDSSIGPGSALTVSELLFSLVPETAYRYRLVAVNSAGPAAPSAVGVFVTRSLGGGSLLPDSRGWEMVSPVDKNGGEVSFPGAIAGGGVQAAAAAGGAVTYGSLASFGAGAGGAPPASQYIATRTLAGWETRNITAPIFSGSYDSVDQGAPYQLFSTDLSRGLLLNGDHCRGEDGDCAVANPPLAGSGAPPGYQNYYLRESSSASFAALLSTADIADLRLAPAHFDLRFAGGSPDLRHVVLSTCAALAPQATEVPVGAGCDPLQPNLYEWSAGAGLAPVNLLPGQAGGAPGAALAAQAGAVSSDGARVYWRDLATGALYLREGGQTMAVDDDAPGGGGAGFQTAAPSGAFAFYLKAGHLYRYDALADASADLTPGGGVVGMLGSSTDGSYAYYLDATGLEVWHEGTTMTIALGGNAADAGSHPPATGTARVSADGTRLAFVSSASLTGYDNADLDSGTPTAQVYLYDAGANSLDCASCNPTNQRPLGPSSIPGSIANGTAPGSTDSYKPRALSANGRRLFFESDDVLAPTDTNSGATDVYQWEAQGEGSCTRAGGCVSLISSGRSPGGASFVDASANGADAFFLTDASLVGADIGAVDLYDARVGGGFPEPPAPIPCEGDACQVLPPAPADPAPTTRLAGPGNPPVRYHRLNRRPKAKHGKHRNHKKRQQSKRHHGSRR